MEKSTTEEFIRKAKNVHGDKYDYSKVEYKNNTTKVCIICPEHGEFWQTPGNHLSGRGCIKCRDENKKTYRLLNNKEFIQRAKEIHGDKYDYSKVEYKGYKTKVCIICPEHGEFWQKPEVHLMGCGCQKCCKTGVKLTTEEFIEKARAIHGNKYDYSKVEYKNAKTKVCIVCSKHGEFWQEPSGHLSGSGCPFCQNKYLTKEQFIERAKKTHGDKYDYSKVKYINNSTKVCIICREHGEFWQTPTRHISGQGCPNCKKSLLENKVKKILDKYSIEYEREKTFEWLKNKTYLRIDFYLPKYKIGVECQGKQHFLTGCSFSKNQGETLEEIQNRDSLKFDLCKQHGIKIIYFSNLKIKYPYDVISKEEDLIKYILQN